MQVFVAECPYSIQATLRSGKGSAPAMVLLLLLLLISSTNCHASLQGQSSVAHTVLTELASQLGITVTQLQDSSYTAADWASIISIQRSLDGKGFHRSLHLNITPAAAASTHNVEHCSISLLQPLPSSILADPYQLEDLTRTADSSGAHKPGFDYTFKLLGPLDLELPAPACEDTALLLTLNTSWQQQDKGAPVTSLTVPLHAKYPQPYAAGFQGWRWTLTGYVAAQVPWPYLLLDCRKTGGALSLLPPPASLQHQQAEQWQGVCTSHAQRDSSCSVGSSSKGEQASDSSGGTNFGIEMVWLVPAGNLDHEVLVSWGTLLVTAVCCIAVSWSALRSSMKKV